MEHSHNAARERDVVVTRHDHARNGARKIGRAWNSQARSHVSGKTSWLGSEREEKRSPQPHRGIHEPNESQEAYHEGRLGKERGAAKSGNA